MDMNLTFAITTFNAVFQFVLGDPHKVMGIAYMLLVLNGITGQMHEKRRLRMGAPEERNILPVSRKASFLERTFAYTVFICLGNMLDMLMVDQLFNWEGSSQFIVCLDVIRREGKTLLEAMEREYGIGMPLLVARLDALESKEEGQIGANDSLDRQLKELQEEIALLKAASPVQDHRNVEE